MNKEDILQKLRDSKPFLTQQFGIESLGLFGSYATEQATTESDIDLFYIPQEGISVGYTQRVLLEEYLTQLL
ncbi:putative nucleotidyltransferase [Catalinimonas alkaloidigena]|uniref:nucleotidyltransferase family protein n=1 Tax=Catalinimonas alkaloidigena TaxID=1075417 RepID=UPI002405D06E|nr:nucleotidyltransferase domain-containing protein [Catalinimonas alkaloidigena]MDF9800262.1 putative nucleotidyltransferase [Catalinimonas alkaloidigena]